LACEALLIGINNQAIVLQSESEERFNSTGIFVVLSILYELVNEVRVLGIELFREAA
jgi:hypothetical protein